MSGEKKMSRIRTATVLVILAVIVTGISMANKPNGGEEDEPSITISPSTLVLSRYVVDVTVHTNIRGSMSLNNLWLYRIIDDEKVYIYPRFVKLDSLGYLVAKFYAEDVKAKVEPGKVELTLETNDGFSASDTIMVKE